MFQSAWQMATSIDFAIWIAGVGLLVAIGSLVVSWRSVKYTRIMAENDTLRMQRKPLVIEPTVSPLPDHENWFEVRLSVRNLEPVTAKIKTARALRKSVKLLTKVDATEPDGSGGRQLLKSLPAEKTKDVIAFLAHVGPAGAPLTHGSPGSSVWLVCYANAPLEPGEVSLDWEWADGGK